MRRLHLPALLLAVATTLGLSACAGGDGVADPGEPREVAVPELVGDRMTTVYDQLAEAGLVARARYWSQRDVVVRVDPEPGTVVAPGTQVRIETMTVEELKFYASNKRVPDLVGLTHSRAQELLGPHSLYLKERYVKGDFSMSRGSVVLSQQPPAGSRLRPGTRIFVVVRQKPYTGGSDLPGFDVDVPNPCAYTRRC